MSGRIIAIGDIHGCADEFEELLVRVSPTGDDRVVLVGDQINRGPDSLRVMDIARSIGATMLLGNHERRLMLAREGKRIKQLSEEDLDTFRKLRPEDWACMDSALLTLHLPEYDTVIVHGGFAPGVDWRTQGAQTVTRVQVVDSKGNALKRSEAPPGCRHWTTLWNAAPFVIYGHTPWREPHFTEWTVGIDTGCVYGGWLSAYILPDRRLVQVPARRCYFRPPMRWCISAW